jgi:WD40 repeat protein
MEVEEEAAMIIDLHSNNDQQEGAPVADDADAELYFLIAHALSGGPLAHIGEMLVGEASARGLLPPRIDYTGQRHSVPYTHLRDRYSHLPQTALRQGLQDLLQYRRAELQAISGRNNVSSILDPAVLPGPSALPSLSTLTARPPLWTLPPFSTKRNGKGLIRPHLAFLRETGTAAGSSGGCGGQEFLSPQAYSQLLNHHFSVRGHYHATYCTMFDRTGSYIITGSDDRLVKIWSVATGLLKRTCRGHDGEISDLAVNCDNSMFASASVDTVIRVWKLLPGEGDTAVVHTTAPPPNEGLGLYNNNIDDPNLPQQQHQNRQIQLGFPVSILQGHTEAVTAIDFSPNQPHILVSTSYDGTARVWDVRDGSIAPLILYSQGAGIGPGSGGGITLPRSLLGGTPGGGGAGGGGGRTTRHSERRQVATVINLSRAAAAAGVNVGGAANGAGPSQQQQEGEVRTRRRAPSRAESEIEEEEVAEAEEDHVDAAEPAAADAPPTHNLLTCSFTKDGRYIVAGSNDFSIYVWRWPKPTGVLEEESGKTAATVVGGAINDDAGPSTSKAAAAIAASKAAAPIDAPHEWPRIDVSNFLSFLFRFEFCCCCCCCFH